MRRPQDDSKIGLRYSWQLLVQPAVRSFVVDDAFCQPMTHKGTAVADIFNILVF